LPINLFLHKLQTVDVADFRSDTVTWPTPAMREAMATASVGDDVYGEDPTVNELEALAAAKVGKEAAVFVASGTMGNLAAILSHAGRGDQAIVGVDAHTYRSEAGGMSALGGVVPRPLPADFEGKMNLQEIESAIEKDDPHYAQTRLILLENTFARKNGAPLDVDYFVEIRRLADRYGLNVHLDGARLFNASTALGIAATDLTRHIDSVTFCLSKGLCAPVGSVLCGSEQFILEARRARKILGGSMRQAGILAAAGIIALNEMIDRLPEDHAKAKRLADGLAQIPGIRLDPGLIKTNIVFFELDDEVGMTTAEICKVLQQEANTLIGEAGCREFRAVTHYWIKEEDVQKLLSAMRTLSSTGWSSR
jgi:threonine aldolase